MALQSGMSHDRMKAQGGRVAAVSASVLLVASVLACLSPASTSLLELQLTAELGKRDFFEGEPLYVAFSLSNRGRDTAWIAPFHLTAWFLRADISEAVAGRLSEWGPTVEYAFPPGYRGQPIPPGKTIYDVALIQDRWGINRPGMSSLYMGHHVPVGHYQLEARFSLDVRQGASASRLLHAKAIAFDVHARNRDEEESFAKLLRLATMSSDLDQRPAFCDSLVVSVQERSADDPVLPLLVRQFVGIARAIGYPPDSVELEVLSAASIGAARTQRRTAAGATAVLAVYSYQPLALRALAEELTGSLAGDVASSIVGRQ